MVDDAGVPTFAPGILAAIRAHADSDPNNEIGGILVSRTVGERRVIVAHIEAHAASGDVTSLTFTHEAWSDIHAELAQNFAGADIAGWYHSHPGHGIFLSAQDRFVHRHFFPADWHVALVVDPQHRTEGLFALRDGEMELVSGSEEPISEAPRRVIEVLLDQTSDSPPFAEPAPQESRFSSAYGFVIPAAVGLLIGMAAVLLGLI